MSSVRDEIMINIGNQLGQISNRHADSWDYAAFAFVHSDSGGSSYLYSGADRISVDLTMADFKFYLENFRRLREITRVDGDDYWISCLAAIRYEDRDFRMLFEFDDASRWQITPANARDAYNIVIGDIFPETVK